MFTSTTSNCEIRIGDSISRLLAVLDVINYHPLHNPLDGFLIKTLTEIFGQEDVLQSYHSSEWCNCHTRGCLVTCVTSWDHRTTLKWTKGRGKRKISDFLNKHHRHYTPWDNTYQHQYTMWDSNYPIFRFSLGKVAVTHFSQSDFESTLLGQQSSDIHYEFN